MKLTNKFKYVSISTRISILLGIIILVTMGAFSTFSLIKQEQDSIDSMSNNALQLSRTTERILRFSMLRNRRDEISMAIKNIVGKEGIMSVRILNHKGFIKFSSKQSEINSHISQTNPLCTTCHDRKGSVLDYSAENFAHYRINKEDSLIYNCLPIHNAPSCYNEVCHATPEQPMPPDAKVSRANPTAYSVHDSSETILGFIEIEVSIGRIVANVERTRMQLIVLTIIIALLASIMTYFSIRQLVGKPVKKLVEGTKRVARGDFTQEISSGQAELRVLADSFNHMQKQLLSTQTQLIESEKLASIGKLADEIANEINNPLTGIIIYTESLISELHSGSDESRRSDYETIRMEALKIRESVRNILSLTTREKPGFKAVDIERAIKHAISVVEKFSHFRNIQIIAAIPRGLPKVSADPGLLEQVFLNLLLNSSESMPTGGIVNISVSHSEDKKEMELRFSDSGRGIPENVLQKIFDPTGTSALENFGKTGITLAVCKDIIEMHRGELHVSSKAGSGTSVTIRLQA